MKVIKLSSDLEKNIVLNSDKKFKLLMKYLRPVSKIWQIFNMLIIWLENFENGCEFTMMKKIKQKGEIFRGLKWKKNYFVGEKN